MSVRGGVMHPNLGAPLTSGQSRAGVVERRVQRHGCLIRLRWVLILSLAELHDSVYQSPALFIREMEHSHWRIRNSLRQYFKNLLGISLAIGPLVKRETKISRLFFQFRSLPSFSVSVRTMTLNAVVLVKPSALTQEFRGIFGRLVQFLNDGCAGRRNEPNDDQAPKVQNAILPHDGSSFPVRISVQQVNLIIALGRPAGNTSNALECRFLLDLDG
jgi:hypothetical protein